MSAEDECPSYDSLLAIGLAVRAALARAGITDCEDPGEAIDVMRENLEARVAFLESERRRLSEIHRELEQAWVVGQHHGADGAWSFQGVFGSREQALAACRDRMYFLAPARIDQELPHGREDWPGLEYPHADAAPQPPGGEVWRPMATAPRDGTMVRLLVQFEDHATEDTTGPAPTIGAYANGADFQGWQFAGWSWTHDHFTDGKGTPIGWLPMLVSARTGGGEWPVAWRILWSPNFPESDELTSDGERVLKVQLLDDPPYIQTLYAAPAEAQAQGGAPARMAIKMLVASGYVTEAKANEALNIAQGFDKGPLAQAQGGGEVVAWHIQHEDGLVALRKRDSVDSHMREQAAADGVRIRPLVYGDTAPPSAPVGVEGLAGKIGVHYAQHESCKPGVPFYAFTADELRRFAAALAQQPAAVDGRTLVELGERLFQFESKQDWINQHQRPWKIHGVGSRDTVCLDQLGRLVSWGEHFSAAERDNAYPIVVYRLRADMSRALDAQPRGEELPPC